MRAQKVSVLAQNTAQQSKRLTKDPQPSSALSQAKKMKASFGSNNTHATKKQSLGGQSAKTAPKMGKKEGTYQIQAPKGGAAQSISPNKQKVHMEYLSQCDLNTQDKGMLKSSTLKTRENGLNKPSLNDATRQKSKTSMKKTTPMQGSNYYA